MFIRCNGVATATWRPIFVLAMANAALACSGKCLTAKRPTDAGGSDKAQRHEPGWFAVVGDVSTQLPEGERLGSVIHSAIVRTLSDDTTVTMKSPAGQVPTQDALDDAGMSGMSIAAVLTELATEVSSESDPKSIDTVCVIEMTMSDLWSTRVLEAVTVGRVETGGDPADPALQEERCVDKLTTEMVEAWLVSNTPRPK